MASEKPRDLETELWEVYKRLEQVPDVLEKSDRQLKALELMVKIRSAGEKVKPPGEAGPVDRSVQRGWDAANKIGKR